MASRRMLQRFIFTVFLLLPLPAFAHIIAITPLAPFPSVVSVFSSPVTATFQVSNISANVRFTAIDQSELPRGLSISANTCGRVLAPGQPCTIQLTLNATSPTSIATYLREWAKPTADGVQFPVNVQVSTMVSGLLFAGAADGNVYISANNGAGWRAFTTMPNNGNPVLSVYATHDLFYAASGDSLFYTANGSTWAQTTAPDGSAINAINITPSAIYVGTTNGNVFFSTNNGASWTSVGSQPDGSAVDSVFVSATGGLYAGTGNGNVEFSNNNGASWTAASTQPDGSPVTSVYLVGDVLYVGTANEFVYTGTLTSGWTLFAQTVNTLFVNSTGSVIDAGTQGGYVYTLTTGAKLGFIANTVINSVFQLS